jgi:hypothetical protein
MLPKPAATQLTYVPVTCDLPVRSMKLKARPSEMWWLFLNAAQCRMPRFYNVHFPLHFRAALRNSPTLLILWHSHIRINRRTKHAKPRTSYQRRLRPRIPRQYTPRNTSARNAIVQIVLRP